MMNPFIEKNSILPIASINSVYIDDVLASDLFRPSLILEELIENKESLGLPREIEDKKLLYLLNDLLKSDFDSVKAKANEIALKYGNRLSKVISTLYDPSLKSVSNRKGWKKKHWDFWQTIENIYLVGGLTSPILTQIFYDCIQSEFQKRNIGHVNIRFIEGSSNLGTKGLSTLVKDGDYLLFDFGQTNIKRARHYKQHNEVVIDTILTPISSDFLFYKFKNKSELKIIANKLDDFIVNTILDTFKQVAFTGNDIYMGIANYVTQGRIYSSRGGYGKLALVSANYELHLSKKLSKLLDKEINITLYHDTSAMALNFKDNKNTAVISLGTAFGIAFPQ